MPTSTDEQWLLSNPFRFDFASENLTILVERCDCPTFHVAIKILDGKTEDRKGTVNVEVACRAVLAVGMALMGGPEDFGCDGWDLITELVVWREKWHSETGKQRVYAPAGTVFN